MVGLLLGVVLVVVSEAVLAGLSRRLSGKRWAGEVFPFVKTTVRFVVLFVFAGVFLEWLGYDVSKVFLGAGGVIGVVIGFGFKDFIGNFAAGVWIMVVDPFDVGDRVTVKGVTGTVEGVTALATVIRADDGKVVYVPNQSVWGGVIAVEDRKSRGGE